MSTNFRVGDHSGGEFGPANKGAFNGTVRPASAGSPRKECWHVSGKKRFWRFTDTLGSLKQGVKESNDAVEKFLRRAPSSSRGTKNQ